MMFNKSKVLFKGKGSGLIIVLDKNASYDDLKVELLNKVKKSKTFFKGASEDIVFEGKELSSEQENEIADIIMNNSGLEIGFINPASDDSFAHRTTNPSGLKEKGKRNDDGEYEKTFSIESFEFSKSEPAASLFGEEEKVLIYNGFVRSGTLVESDGNIVIIGGVNPGGEVFAGRNVIVFGQLKGKAVAGRNGDDDCVIAAILMEPELLGISGFVTRFPSAKKSKLNKNPSIARLEANKIIISQAGNLGVVK